LLRGKWRYTEPLDPILQNKPILTIADQSYTVNEFFDYVQQRQQVPRNPAMTTGAASSGTIPAISGSPGVAMRRLFNRYVGDRLIATEEKIWKEIAGVSCPD
jgi:peptidyl-prolyl cis-trans isomerase SurA